MVTTATRPVFETPGRPAPKPGTVRFVDVPERRCLMVDGAGSPGAPEFQAAIGALYAVAYSLKFMLKRRGVESKVGCLEGLWTRTGEASELPLTEPMADPTAWQWTLLIEAPETASAEDIAAAIAEVWRKRPSSAIEHLRCEPFREGHVVEALHVGPYASEPETISRMYAVAAEWGLQPVGPHHEIYLGDPQRSAPERLKTVLRMPVA